MASSTIHVKQNDTAPPASTTLKVSGAAVDIENATIEFRALYSDGRVLIEAAANNDQVGDGSDGTKGMVSYDWTAADTAISGIYRAVWKVTFADGTVRTFPTRGGQPMFIWANVEDT